MVQFATTWDVVHYKKDCHFIIFNLPSIFFGQDKTRKFGQFL